MVEDSTNPIDALDIEMDAAGLYTEEVVTDRRVGTIRVMTPVKTDGQRDLDRPMLFVGETQIMTQMGPLPVTFEIPADNVGEAVEKFGAAAKDGVKKLMERLQEMRREAASQIVTPGMPGFQAPPPPAGGSGLVMP
ncbi:hypothetical protein H6A60_00050 [Sutterella massiliensis]|uniref:Cytoplasmic protein n=1 Tax=Sutterella massiliensis TaxID=1816689 RepID=A0ABS2DNA2_9BURK|nr:hypothetical protein [Sutterella massiliensis]MBM6702906.1 hypothetical protein [Sutterella massiliensis]